MMAQRLLIREPVDPSTDLSSRTRLEEFDRCYAKAQYLAHMDAMAMFEAEAQRGLDPQIKAFASRTLPHIKEHLNTIKPIALKYNKEMGQTDDANSQDKAGNDPK